MNNLIPLMRREWLQHRFAWSLLVLVPMALAVLPLSFGQIELDHDISARSAPELAAMFALVSIVASTAIVFLIVWLTSLFITVMLARRDHADRSVEFWLSLPTGHAESFAAPFLVHLLLVPAAAVLLGLLGGFAMSLLVVTRFVGFGEWLALPWATLLAGTLAVAARVIAGLPLATLWLSPLILLAVLAYALLRKWGLPVLAIGLGLGSAVLQYIFGQPLLGAALARIGQNASLALAGASRQGVVINSEADPIQSLQALPGWALTDLLAALRDAASPAFAGGLVLSAALFMALVLWRQRGAASAH